MLYPAAAGAKQRLAQLGFSRSGQSGNAKDLAFMQGQVNILKQFFIMQPGNMQQFSVLNGARRGG